jgi:hypothetical protein
MMQNYIDVGIGNYVVFNMEQINYVKPMTNDTFQGFWKMSFDGACSKSGIGVGIVLKIHNLVFIHMQSDLSFHAPIMKLNMRL